MKIKKSIQKWSAHYPDCSLTDQTNNVLYMLNSHQLFAILKQADNKNIPVSKKGSQEIYGCCF